MGLGKFLRTLCLWILALSWIGGMGRIGYQIVENERALNRQEKVSPWQISSVEITEDTHSSELLQVAIPQQIGPGAGLEPVEWSRPSVEPSRTENIDRENYNRKSFRQNGVDGIYQSDDGQVLFYNSLHNRWFIGPDTQPAHAFYKHSAASTTVPPQTEWEVTSIGKAPAPVLLCFSAPKVKNKAARD